MRMEIEVWAVSNLTFVLLCFTILNLTIEVPFKVLALYSLRYGTLKRGNGDATYAVCRLRKGVSEALYAIANSLYYTKSLYATHWCKKLQAYLLLNEIHVEICQARRCHTRRSFA